MKTGIIIQARLGSTRFPKKAMADLIGKPMIWWVIERAKKSRLADIVILATTSLEMDKILEKIAKEQKIEFFRGSKNDVLDRYYQAAKKYGLDIIVRITGDCPLIDSKIIDKAIEAVKDGYDYASNTYISDADGFDVEVFTLRELEYAWKNAVLASEREHVTQYIRKKCNNIYNIKNDERSEKLHCSVDRVEDLEFVKKIIEGLSKKYQNNDFRCKDVLDYLNEHPEIRRINEKHEINEGLKKSLEEDKSIS